MRKRVALFLMNSTTHYQVYMETTARAAAEQHDIDLEVSHSADGEQENPIRHITQIFESLRQGPGRVPDAVLIQPMSTHCPSVVEAAARVRVPCAVMNRSPIFLPEMRRRFPGVPLFSISPDQRAMGRIQGEQFRALLPRGGRLLYVQGIEIASATQDRREGMMASIAGSGIEVVSLYGDWVLQSAENAVKEWLDRLPPNQKPPDLFGCQNDEMAEGVRRAIERFTMAHRGSRLIDRPITGCDGIPNHGQRLVREGVLAATITRGSSSAVAIEALVDYFERGVFPPVHTDMPVDSFPAIDSLTARAPPSTN